MASTMKKIVRNTRLCSYRNMLWLCLSLSLFTACNKMVEIDPYHAASEEQQWNKIEDARSGLMGIYGLTRAALVEHNGHWLNGDVRGGDFTVRKGARSEERRVGKEGRRRWWRSE